MLAFFQILPRVDLLNIGPEWKEFLLLTDDLCYMSKKAFTAFSFIIFCCLNIGVPDHCTHFPLPPNWFAMQCSVVRSPDTVTCPLSFICLAFLLQKGRGCLSSCSTSSAWRWGMYKYFLLTRIGLTYPSPFCLC